MKAMKFLIGIDEAGRGPLAGPIAVGAVCVPTDFVWQELFALVTKRGEPVLRDSKKLSPAQREVLYERIVADDTIRYACAFSDAAMIDKIGIVPAANAAVAEALRMLGVSPRDAQVSLDAGLCAPSEWKQESFVRGDENIPAIALASIIAKVSRDRFMTKIASSYPAYGFETHKGYGTLAHRQAIEKEGLSAIHRRSFCRALRSAEKSV